MNIRKLRWANKNSVATEISSIYCILDYEITDINQERSELFSSHGDTRSTNNNVAYDYYITPNDGTHVNQVVTGIWDHDSPGGPEKNGYFWIRAIAYHNKIGVSPTTLASPKNQKSTQLHTGTIVLQQEVKMWVNIIDPCIRGTPGATNSITVPTAISDMIYVINGHPAATTRNVNFWKDEASTLYGYGAITTVGGKSQNNPWHVCGAKTYKIFRADQTTEMDTSGSVYPYFTWTDSVHSTTADPTDIILSVRTALPEYYTNALVRYWIRATLDDYIILYPTEATQWISFDVNLENCIVTDYTFSNPTSSYQWSVADSQIVYNVYTPWQWIEMADFVEVVTYAGS